MAKRLAFLFCYLSQSEGSHANYPLYGIVFAQKLLLSCKCNIVTEKNTINLRTPVVSILDDVLTVSPKRQYLGMTVPTTPATTGPKKKNFHFVHHSNNLNIKKRFASWKRDTSVVAAHPRKRGNLMWECRQPQLLLNLQLECYFTDCNNKLNEARADFHQLEKGYRHRNSPI